VDWQVAKELTARSQNAKIKMWIDDGVSAEVLKADKRGLLAYLTSKTLLPALLDPSATDHSAVVNRFRFLGRFISLTHLPA
jgi:hypothetical protein